jgi:ADP-ribosyl-[dinitrogen reductase] hydrolase
MDKRSRYRGSLLGLAAGDAVGTTVEFKARGSFPPVTDMTGEGPFNLRPGEWTDDTSMALCLAASLVETGEFDPDDQMRRYFNWYKYGYMSSNDVCFDIGSTVRQALDLYGKTGDPFIGASGIYSAGNGSIMRLAPVVSFFYPSRVQALHYAVESSRTTHAAKECLDACLLLADILFQILSGKDRKEALLDISLNMLSSPKIKQIAAGSYINKTDSDIRGSTYVVESLEAALWSFWHTDNFRDAILAAANLGEDADTTAAVCGQIAGAYYGEDGIPADWLDQLARAELIGQLAEGLMREG